MSEHNVKPQDCPSCKTAVTDDHIDSSWENQHYVWCECGLNGPYCKTRDGAITKWNMISINSVPLFLNSNRLPRT